MALQISSFPVSTHNTAIGPVATHAGQVFTVGGTGFDITDVGFRAFRNGTPGNLTLNIYAVDGANKPTGASLATAAYNANTITNDPVGEEVTVTLDTPASLSASTSYCFIVTITYVSPNYLALRGRTDNPYASGGQLNSIDGGSNWTYTAAYDRAFKIYGTAGGSPPSKAISPDPADSSDPGVDFTDWTLSWTDGGGATSFDVHLGDSEFTLNPVAEDLEVATYTIPVSSPFRNYALYRPAYWRIDSINQYGTTVGDVWTFDPRPAKVTNPSPIDDATSQRLNLAQLSWDASAIADTYDVYFDTGSLVDLISVAQEGTTCSNFGQPLGYSTEYLWRIDPENEFGTTEGDEWSFTTLAFDPPSVSARYIADGSVVPPGTPFNPSTMYFTGENFQAILGMLLAAADDAIWYEDIKV